MWYNATNLIEWSNVRIFDWYLRNGLEHLLKERPYFVTSTIIKDSKMNNKYGIDPSTKIHWLKMLSDYLDENSVAQMDDTYQIERLAKFRYEPRGKYNCDTTISSALCIVNMQDDLIEMETDREERVYKEEPMFSYRRSGNSFKIV